MVMLTSVVVPARQRLTRSVPAPVFSASVMAVPKALRASEVNEGTVPESAAMAPRITSSTASESAVDIGVVAGVLATVTRIWRLASEIRPEAA